MENTEGNPQKLQNFNCSKIKKKGDETDQFYLPDNYCLEVWIKNIKLLNRNNNKERLYIVELHCYDGFAMVKFYPKFIKGKKDRYRLRGHEITSEMPVSQVRKVLKVCGDIMYHYIETYPKNYVGYIGQVDSKDNLKNRFFSQRAQMYEVFVNTKFKQPKYSILDNNFLNDFNIKLIRKVLSKKGLKYRTTEQSKNYKSFITHLKRLTKEDLAAMMTIPTLERYLKNNS